MIDEKLSRAQGCLMGQLAGDSLGGLVEFSSRESILGKYPDGVRLLEDGGTWGTLAGQPTDDSEMALMLARSLVRNKAFDKDDVLKSYRYWLDSHPFDCGFTTSSGLRGNPNFQSQANGALMRISPLGIFGAKCSLEDVGKWARQDAELTHPHIVCRQASELFAKAIAYSIANGPSTKELYGVILDYARQMDADPSLVIAVENAGKQPPEDYMINQGWVLVALQNALWQLVSAKNLEEAVVSTVMCGGDTDTNAAICGALYGAVAGIEAVPAQWTKAIVNCRPEKGGPGVRQPRPECFWPCDALELAAQLLG